MKNNMFPSNYPIERIPKGYEQLTVSTTAVALTIPTGATRAVIKVDAQPVRLRNDGVDPTATVGYLLKADDTIELTSEGLTGAKFIRDGGTDGVLNIIYYGSQ